jgi:hypothetical protein
METVLLTVPPGIAPRTKDGDWGLVMAMASGRDEKSQWFDYRPNIYGAPVRAEWALGTMAATVAPHIAKALVENGYARVMTLDEAKTYNKKVERHIDATTGVQLKVS